MTSILQHKDVPAGHIHSIVNWVFADIAEMEAYTTVVTKDLNKVAKVLDTGAGDAGYYVLDKLDTGLGTRTWTSIFGGSGAGVTNLGLGAVTLTNVTVTSDTGTDVELPAATSDSAGVATAEQIFVLESLNSIVSNLTELTQDTVAAMLVAGANITLTYNDIAGTITVASSGGGGGGGGSDAAFMYTNTPITSASGIRTIAFNSTSFDNNSICNTGTGVITPKKAGYYQVSVNLDFSVDTRAVAGVYKNGAIYSWLGSTTIYERAGGSVIVYCNGTTDYIQPCVYTLANTQILAGSSDSNISIIGPL